MVECNSDSFWCYTPNKAAPIAFAVLYGISAIAHAYQAWHYRAKYAIPLIVGTTFTTVGFGFKAYSSNHTDMLVPWLVATILLFVAPPVYAAADFFVFAKVSHYVPSQAPMHPGRVVTTFVAADTICELLMGNAAGLIVDLEDHTKVLIGNILIKTGLILQVILFVGFIAVVIRFHQNCRKAGLIKRWVVVIYVLYASTAFICIRCIYRVVEYFEGVEGVIYRTEAYFHVFEAALMFLNTITLNIWHPGRFLPMDNTVFLNEQGEETTEGDRGGWDDNRPFIATLYDPFNIKGLYQVRKEKKAARRAQAMPEVRESV